MAISTIDSTGLAPSITLVTPVVSTTMGVGNATPSASGSGITFPATQSASSDANTLDDYEEGAWTPTATANAGTITAYTSGGSYTKIGRLVAIQGSIRITTPGTASGTLNAVNLPFPVASIISQVPGIVREADATGVVYQSYTLSNGTVAMSIATLSNGSVSWTSGYNYNFNFTYFTS